MRRSMMATAGLVLAAVLMAGCEPPNHVDSPADGSTMYFAFGPTARFELPQGSQLYAFDVERCRLRCLSDDPRMNVWVTGNDDGSRFSWTRCLSQSDFQLHVQGAGAREGRQLGAAYNAYGGSSFVPGNGWLLAYEGRTLETMHWTLFDPAGSEIGMPYDKELKAVGTDTPALAKNRVAVAVYGMNKDYPKTSQKPYGVWVYVIDLSSGKPVATLAGMWEVHYHEIPIRFLESPTIDLSFSPDGSKIVAAWYSLTKTTFYELDAKGAAKPKELFSDAKALRPAYMSDGKGVAYMRVHPDAAKYNVMQVMLRRPDDAQPKALAELPGLPRTCGTALRRLADGRMRVMHLSNDGLAVVECAVDGSGVTTRSVPTDKMEKQRQLARFEYVFKQNPSVNQWQAPYEVSKLVPTPTPAGAKREDDVALALEKAFAETSVWKSETVAAEPTPSVPSVPALTPSVPSVPSIPIPTP